MLTSREWPTCSVHGPMDHHVFQKDNPLHEFFKCRVGKCPESYLALKPPCPRCKSPLAFRKAKHGANAGKNFWGCPSYPRCRGAIDFSVCGECDGMRWLHMDNSGGLDENQIGHYGRHIEACNICSNDFGDIHAATKHAHDCGCGHGMANPEKITFWQDYRGLYGEVERALRQVGFTIRTENYRDGEISVKIPPESALIFNSTLTKIYDEMQTKSDAERILAFPERYPPVEIARAMAILHPPSPTTAGLKDFTEKVQKLLPPPKELKANIVIGQDLTEKPIPDDEGLLDWSQTVTGRMSCTNPPLSNRPREDIQPVAADHIKGLIKNSTALLNVLNGMRFQDHSIAEQRELEAARRKLFMAVSEAEKREGKGIGGIDADFRAEADQLRKQLLGILETETVEKAKK